MNYVKEDAPVEVKEFFTTLESNIGWLAELKGWKLTNVLITKEISPGGYNASVLSYHFDIPKEDEKDEKDEKDKLYKSIDIRMVMSTAFLRNEFSRNAIKNYTLHTGDYRDSYGNCNACISIA